MLGAACEPPRHGHLPRARRSTCAWPGSPPPTPRAGPGLDYEEIDDVRIAVSELCSLVSLDAAAHASRCRSEIADGVADRDGRIASTGAAGSPATSSPRRSSPPSSTSTRSRPTAESPVPGHEALAHARPDIPTRVLTRRRRLSGDWSLRRLGPGGAGTFIVPAAGSRQTLGPAGKIAEKCPPLQSTDAAQAAAPAALRRHRGRRRGARRRVTRRWRSGTAIERNSANGNCRSRSSGWRSSRTAYTDQETGERGYALTGATTFLEPYTTAGERATRLVRALREALDTSESARRLERGRRGRSDLAARGGRAGDRAARHAGRRGGGARLRSRPAAGGRCSTGCGTASARSARRVQHADDAAPRTPRRHPRRLTWFFVARRRSSRSSARSSPRWLIRRWVTRPIDALGDGGAPRARRCTRLADPDRRATGAVVARRSTSTPCAAASASSWSMPKRSREAVEQSAAVVLTLRSRARARGRDASRRVDGRRAAARGRRRRRGRLLRPVRHAASGDIAPDRRRHRRARRDRGHPGAPVQGGAPDRAHVGCRAGRRAGDHRRAARRHGRRGVPHRVRRGRSTPQRRPDPVRQRRPSARVHRARAIDADDLDPTGPLVGLLWCRAGRRPRPRSAPGDNLCAYTDGLIETRNVDNEFFGPERLVDLLQGVPVRPGAGGGEALHRRGRSCSRPADSATTRRSSYCVEPSERPIAAYRREGAVRGRPGTRIACSLTTADRSSSAVRSTWRPHRSSATA